MKNLVITGCQRSGTMYTSVLLSAAGFTCGHERYFRIDREEGFPEGTEGLIESSSSALHALRGNEVVVCQLRHPLRVAASMIERGTLTPTRRVRHLPPSGRWIAAIIPELQEEEEELRRVLLYWTEWNRRVLERARVRWRVEKIDPSNIEYALTLAGHELGTMERDRIQRALYFVPSSVNTSDPTSELTWDAVPDSPIKDKARELAEEVGYDA